MLFLFCYFVVENKKTARFPQTTTLTTTKTIAMSSEHAMDAVTGKNGIEEDIEDASNVEDVRQPHLPHQL